MDLNTACKILEIEIEEISKISVKQLKKKYHILALKHHPDKNVNKSESTEYFQIIREAYEYIFNEINDSFTFTEYENNEPNNDYIHLVSLFISEFIKGVSIDSFMKIMKILLSGWKELSLQLFDDLNKEKTFEIYNFICKYKHILYIHEDIITKLKEILLNKFKDDKVFILNPSLHDLLENNIYKLVNEDKLYIVPLWHNELYFDNNGNDIIVLCIPELEPNISIDENNNIIIELHVYWNCIIKEKIIKFMLGQKEYVIPVEKLYIKSMQTYILRHHGISQIIDGDIYNISNKSDIIIKIYILES
jgi:hypothetical protein